MASFRHQLPAASALWAILWRSVLYFPFAVLWFAAAFALVWLIALVAIAACMFALEQNWFYTVAYGAAALTLGFSAWRFCFTRGKKSPNTPSGFLV